MENFPIKKDGKTYWVSRSMATVVNVYTSINGEDCVLANKRGKGLPNNVGKWNCPSGFLDYGETLKECAAREVYEETGLKLNPEQMQLFELDSDPERENENVLVRYIYIINDYEQERYKINNLTNEHSEINEVEEVKWIPFSEVDNYEWVSDKHKNLIKKAYYETIKDAIVR